MEYKALTLTQSAQFDKGAKHLELTWTVISATRQMKGISRAARIKRGEGKRGGLISRRNGVK